MKESQQVDINLNIRLDVDGKQYARSTTINANSNAKIKTNFTAGQLGFFFRIMMDLGYVDGDNKTEIANILAQTFTTLKTDELSSKSLKTKFYDPDHKTIENIKERLREMIEMARSTSPSKVT